MAGLGIEGDTIAAKFAGAGQAMFTSSPLGKALHFDGKCSDNAGDAVRFDRSDAFSYGAWVDRQGRRRHHEPDEHRRLVPRFRSVHR